MQAITCHIPKVFEAGRGMISCNTEITKQGAVIKRTNPEGEITWQSSTTIAYRLPPQTPTHVEATGVLKTINELTKRCEGQGYANLEQYQLGKVVEIRQWGNSKQYGFTGTIVGFVETNVSYRLRVDSIHAGPYNQLNPHPCSEKKFLNKWNDEGALVTVFGDCFK